MGKSINFLSYIPVLVTVLVLGYWVYYNNKKSLVNKLFFCICVCIGLWTVSLLVADTANIYFYAYWGSQFAMIGPLFLGPVFYLFSRVFPRGKLDVTKIEIFLIFLPSIIAFLLFPTKFNVEKIIIRDWGAEVFPGILYPILFVIMLTYFGLGIKNFYKKYKAEVGLQRLQILYVTLGISISTFLAITTNLILVVLGISKYSILGPAVFLVFIGLTSYAILRYRLMDVRVIIRRSAVFTSIVLLITAIYAILAFTLSLIFTDIFGVSSLILNGVVMAILVAVGFEPLKKRLAAVTDKYLFKAEYNPNEVLSEFAEKMSATLDLDILSQYLTKRLSEVFKTTFVSLFLLDEKKSQYLRVAVSGKPILDEQVIDQKLFSAIFNYLKSIKKEKDIFVREEVKKINEIYKNKILDIYYETLNKYGINTVVPLYTQEKLIGIIFLGDKKSGDAFSLEDIKMLGIISGQSAVAMQNSSFYKEVNDLNKNLEKKVKEQTQAIVEKNVRLEKLLKVKSEFLDIASHQLRTPVSVICGILDMFKSGSMDSLPKEKQMKFIDNAFLKGRKLNAVIDDILDASDLDEKELDLKDSLVDLDFSALVKDVVNYNKMEAEEKKVAIKTDIADNIMIKSDKKYLEQAVGNIFDNAIKYSAAGKSIEITLKKEGNKAVLAVKDEGIGIPKAEQANLFNKFSRATNAKEMHTDGSGLGLFIVKKIIGAHPEGKIWFESEESKGTTFYIQLLTI